MAFRKLKSLCLKMKQIRTVTNVQYKVRGKISHWVVGVSINQSQARHEKSPLPRIKYVVKGFVKATFARI